MECDYVVVGAGAAGCAAAARLALAGHDVILLEAGDDPDLTSKIPMAAQMLLGSSLDWQYKSISNNASCLSHPGAQCRFSRGKCLGGSTSINYMLYTRGNRRDYDGIPEPGWTWEHMKPYFLRYEGLQVLDRYPPSSVPYHNTTGTMKLDYFDNPDNPWHSKLIEGFLALNFPYNPDVNGKSQIGVTRSAGYVYNGERMSAARGYLSRQDVKRRLRVAKRAHCTGVVIDEHNAACGVTAVQAPGNRPVTVRARKEVILSAGTIGTPQILLLSGVGPAGHLSEMGIRVRSDLPVGHNMSDHVLPVLFVRVDSPAGVAPRLRALVRAVSQLTEYIVRRGGPLASVGLADVLSFANLDCFDAARGLLANDSAACELPDLELMSVYLDRYMISFAKPFVRRAFDINDDVLEQVTEINENHALIVMTPVVLQPKSRGRVYLASADPLRPPAIFANYLGDARDVEQMLRSVRLLERLVETAPFARQDARLVRLQLRGCADDAASGDSYWRCYVRHLTHAVFHAAGTCALGAVVDAQLRVRGVRRLRVADLSVLPYVPRGNTAAVALAVGERLADFIKQDRQHGRGL